MGAQKPGFLLHLGAVTRLLVKNPVSLLVRGPRNRVFATILR